LSPEERVQKWLAGETYSGQAMVTDLSGKPINGGLGTAGGTTQTVHIVPNTAGPANISSNTTYHVKDAAGKSVAITRNDAGVSSGGYNYGAGYGGGAGGSGGSGAGGGNTMSLFNQLKSQYDKAYAAAQAANKGRENELRKSYDDIYQRTMQNLAGLGTQQRADVNEAYRNMGQRVRQQATDLGYGASGSQIAMLAGNERERLNEMRRVQEALSRERIGYDTSLTQAKRDFIERITDKYPDMSLLMQLAGQMGQGSAYGGAGSVYGGSGLGGVYSSVYRSPATTQPQQSYAHDYTPAWVRTYGNSPTGQNKPGYTYRGGAIYDTPVAMNSFKTGPGGSYVQPDNPQQQYQKVLSTLPPQVRRLFE